MSGGVGVGVSVGVGEGVGAGARLKVGLGDGNVTLGVGGGLGVVDSAGLACWQPNSGVTRARDMITVNVIAVLFISSNLHIASQ